MTAYQHGNDDQRLVKTRRQAAYARAMVDIHEYFGRSMNDARQAQVWKHVETIPEEYWPQIVWEAQRLWEKIPGQIGVELHQLYRKCAKSATAAAPAPCEHCNGVGYFSGEFIHANYNNGNAYGTWHTILCRGCENWRRSFGDQAARDCARLYPLEATRGGGYSRVIIGDARPGDMRVDLPQIGHHLNPGERRAPAIQQIRED